MGHNTEKKSVLWTKYLNPVMGLIILFLVILNFDREIPAQIFQKSNLNYFFLAVVVYFLNNVLMSYRLNFITKKIGKKLRFKSVFISHMAGMIASDVTPGRIGYIYTAIPLTKNGLKAETSIAAIFFCYVSDAIMKVLVVTVGLFYLKSILTVPSSIEYTLYAGIIVSLIIIASFFLFFSKHFRSLWGMYDSKIPFVSKVSAESGKFWRIFFSLLGFSFFGWVLHGVEWYLVALSLGMDLDIIISFILYPLTSMLSLMQFSIFELGIESTGIDQVFNLFGFLQMTLLFVLSLKTINLVVDFIGLTGFFTSRQLSRDAMKDTYEQISGDVDEEAYNSEILVQKYWQRKRVREIVENLDLKEGDKVLDVACGSGVISRKCAEKGAIVCGIDLNSHAMKFASSKIVGESSFLVADAENLPFRENYFDAVICSEVIEHLHQPDKMISDVTRVLKPGGKLCVFTPNSRSAWPMIEYLWDRFGAGRDYGETHLKIFNKSELRSTLSDYDLYILETYFFISPFVALLRSEWLLNKLESLEDRSNSLGLGAEVAAWGILKNK